MLFGVSFEVSEAVGVLVRHFMSRGYEAFYTVNERDSHVYIVAFLHGSRDALHIVSHRPLDV